jgi:YD repeat-containing protein
MKFFTGTFLLLVLAQVCEAQYYYKDLMTAKEGKAKWQLYKESRVRSVKLNSYERDGSPAEGFVGEQEAAADYSHITTHTKAKGMAESWSIAKYTAEGLTEKITDTSESYRSVSDYTYDGQGRISSIQNTSIETDNHLKEVELHTWSYDAAGKPSGMLKIKNGLDTTFVRFILDEKGNVAEERSVRNREDLPTIYYYYDADNRLTDIVRYNFRAKRLLPDNIFEYGDGGRLSSMLVIPEGSNEYLKWLYAYDEKGLKTKEVCYSRQKELLGKIDYLYNFK